MQIVAEIKVRGRATHDWFGEVTVRALDGDYAWVKTRRFGLVMCSTASLTPIPNTVTVELPRELATEISVANVDIEVLRGSRLRTVAAACREALQKEKRDG